MIKRALASAIALAALLQGCSPTTAVVGFGSAGAADPGSAPTDQLSARPIGSQLRDDVLEVKLLEEVNEYRSRHDLPPLVADRAAADAADWISRYQASVMTMTHTSNVAGMEQFDARYRKLGGARIISGAENIAWHQLGIRAGAIVESYDELAARIVGDWIDSPSHRKNLLLSGSRGVGIAGLGVARGTNGGLAGVYSTMDVFYVEQPRGATKG
jgi:uncharacterized protein YkwD